MMPSLPANSTGFCAQPCKPNPDEPLDLSGGCRQGFACQAGFTFGHGNPYDPNLDDANGFLLYNPPNSYLEAVELTATLRPDLVTMDLMMPGMDGMEATRRIMETQPVPIVIVSASFDAGVTWTAGIGCLLSLGAVLIAHRSLRAAG